MKVSIIVLNYNYARYLQDSIGNSLKQSYKNTEVIVVDDGSTDASLKIIEKYGNSIKKISQSNKGMIEASNSGFSESTGEILIFLDADDYLYSNAVSRIVEIWEPGTSKVQFRLKKVDNNGKDIGHFPSINRRLDGGEVWKKIINQGEFITATMSGNAFSRQVLEKIFPIKDAKIGKSGTYFDIIPTDSYLAFRVPFFGPVLAIQDSLGVYRIHGVNLGASKNPYNNKLKRQRILKKIRLDSEFIEKQLDKMGFEWHEDRLFRSYNNIRLRILSYRFDRDDHIWKEDTKIKLIIDILSGFRYQSSYHLIKRMYYLIINILLVILPKRLTVLLLNRIVIR
jgi:glycosyltransferase involved in cell wall biosynthesis